MEEEKRSSNGNQQTFTGDEEKKIVNGNKQKLSVDGNNHNIPVEGNKQKLHVNKQTKNKKWLLIATNKSCMSMKKKKSNDGTKQVRNLCVYSRPGDRVWP